MRTGVVFALGALGLLGLAGLASGVTVKSPGPGPGLRSRASRVLLIGDSLAVGLKGPLAVLAGQAGIPFDGHGIVGTRIDQWAANPKVDDYLAAFKPTHVLVSLGTNDEKVGTGWAAKEAPKLHALLEKLQASGAEIWWIGPPTLPFAREGVSELVRSLVPRYFPSELLSIQRSPDQLHPTGAGYSSWAAQIWKWLMPGL